MSFGNLKCVSFINLNMNRMTFEPLNLKSVSFVNLNLNRVRY